MAADFLTINTSKQLGAKYVRAANLVRELRELIDSLSDAGSHSFDGADYSVFETNFGVATGQGANALTLINLMQEIFNSNVDVSGAFRLSRIEEFVARVAGQ